MEKIGQNNFTKRMLFLAIEVGLIFAIPAVLVGIFGPKIDALRGTEEMWTIILLIVALIISWSIVIRKYKEANKEIKDKKEKLNGSTQN